MGEREGHLLVRSFEVIVHPILGPEDAAEGAGLRAVALVDAAAAAVFGGFKHSHGFAGAVRDGREREVRGGRRGEESSSSADVSFSVASSTERTGGRRGL